MIHKEKKEKKEKLKMKGNERQREEREREGERLVLKGISNWENIGPTDLNNSHALPTREGGAVCTVYTPLRKMRKYLHLQR